MCQPGEIVVIEKFLDSEKHENTRHSFVVLSNEFWNNEEGFIKCNQLHYFDLTEDEINIIGSVNATVWDKINEALDKYEDKIIINTYNLKADEDC